MQQTPYLIPWFISIALTFALGVYAFRHRKTPAAVSFTVMCFLATLWATGYVFELSSLDINVKILAAKIEYFGIVGVPLSWTAFALQFTGRGQWLTRRTVALALIVPAITLVMVWTTEIHGLLWSELSLTTDEVSGLVTLWAPAGWWFWIHAVYTYSILLMGAFFLLRQFWEQQDIYRTQTFINIIAILAPWISNGLVIFRLLPIKIDITSVTFGVSILLLGWAFFRYRFLDLVPVAHRAVFDSIPDSVIVLDPTLRVAELNPAALRLFGVEPGQVIGQGYAQAFGHWLKLDESHLGENGYHEEVQVHFEGQPVKWFDVTISLLEENSSQGAGKLLILRDVTSRKENEVVLAVARDEALQASNFKTQLLAKVSHELRTPLGVMIGYNDLLVRGSYGRVTEKQVTILGRMRSSGDYLDALISELLDQAQLDSGKLKLAVETFSPGEVFGRACSQLSILAEAKKLEFVVQFSPDLPETISGDSNRLQQILTNLIGNAIKFTEAGRISIELGQASDSEWFLKVTDTGPGIPEGALETIFEPFRQLEQSAKTRRKGYGLGLSITKQLIELMGGRINVQSQVGKGSTFLITLPNNMTTE
jgi:PAS domain S-box-containing protein